MRVQFLLAIALIGATGCLGDAPIHLDEIATTPESLDDGWEIARPEDVGLDSAALDAVVEHMRTSPDFYMSRSLLVIRRGKLVLEAYLDDPSDRDRLQHVKSASKTITSLVYGIALDRNEVPGPETRLWEIIPEAFDGDERKRAITLRDLLTMRSGLDWRNEEDTRVLKVNEPQDSVSFTLAQTLEWAPGTWFQYKDADPHLVGAAVQRATGVPFDEYAAAHLFGPLGISDWRWERHRDGVPYGAFGVWLRPRDMAKLGQLCLQQGQWQGEQVVSSGWLEESTRAWANQNDGPYGYYWWIRPEYGAWTMAGHGGQYVYVIPEDELVIVHTARPYTSQQIWTSSFETLVQKILEARIP